MSRTARTPRAVTLLSKPARSTVLPASRRPSARGHEVAARRCRPRGAAAAARASKATIWPRTGSTGGGRGSPAQQPRPGARGVDHRPAPRSVSAPARTPATRPPSTHAGPVTGRPHEQRRAARHGRRGQRARSGARCRRARSPAKNRPRRTAGVRFGSASRISAAVSTSTGRPRARCQARRDAQRAPRPPRVNATSSEPCARELDARCPSPAPARGASARCRSRARSASSQQGRAGLRSRPGARACRPPPRRPRRPRAARSTTRTRAPRPRPGRGRPTAPPRPRRPRSRRTVTRPLASGGPSYLRGDPCGRGSVCYPSAAP